MFSVFRRSVEQSAVTSSEQAVVQASNTVYNYTKDMEEIMGLIEDSYRSEEEERNHALDTLLRIRKDVIAVTSYNENGGNDRFVDGRLSPEREYIEKSFLYPTGNGAGRWAVHIGAACGDFTGKLLSLGGIHPQGP